MKHIFVEMQQHKKERGTRKTKTLHIDLVIMKKYSRMKYLFSEAEILDLFQCVSKMHTYWIVKKREGMRCLKTASKTLEVIIKRRNGRN